MSSTEGSGTSQFVTSAVINLVIGLVLILFFSFARRYFPGTYSPRTSDWLRNPGYKPGDRFLKRPPPQASKFLGWIGRTYYYSESDMLKTAGLDAVLTLRFFYNAFKFFLIATVICIAVVLPVQYEAARDVGVTGINAFSTSSVGEGDHRIAINVAVMYVITFMLFYMLYRQWVQNVDLIARWLRREQMCGRRLTVYVERVGPAASSTTWKFREFWEALFPSEIAGTVLVRDVSGLSDLMSEREEAVHQLNHIRGQVEIDFETNHARPRHNPKFCGCGPCASADDEVDSLDYYTDKVRTLDWAIAAEEQKDHKLSNCGFVTFHSARAFSQALTVPIVSRPNEFDVYVAPEPSDIRWLGVAMPPPTRVAMHMLMSVAHFFLVFFWVVPVGFVSSLTSLQELSKRLPFLEPVVDANPVVKGFLEGFLPALAMIIFMSILPLILRVMGIAQGIQAETWLDLFIFRRYFVFQLFNFFLVTCLAGSVIKQIDSIIHNPTSIVTLLATSLPATADVFMAYILLQALMANAMGLSNVVAVILTKIKRYFATTIQEIRDVYTPSNFFYGKSLPESVLIMIIGIAFCTIQPLVTPCAALYFGTSFFYNKHAMMHIVVNK